MIIGLDIRAENRSEKIQVLSHGKVRIQGEFPGHVAHYRPELLVVLYYIQALHGHLSFIRRYESGQKPEKGGLAGTVRANHSEELALGHGKAVPEINCRRKPSPITFPEGLDYDAIARVLHTFRV